MECRDAFMVGEEEAGGAAPQGGAAGRGRAAAGADQADAAGAFPVFVIAPDTRSSAYRGQHLCCISVKSKVAWILVALERRELCSSLRLQFSPVYPTCLIMMSIDLIYILHG